MLNLLVVAEKSWNDVLGSQIAREYPYAVRLETADNGFAALERVHKLKPDILIADIDLKDISAFIIAKKAIKEVPDVKVIFISGSKDFKFAKEALRLKACAYLLKPVDSIELSNSLEKAVCQRLEEIQFEEEKVLLSKFVYAECL